MSPGRQGRRVTDRGDRRRDGLIEAATDLLAEQGFGEVTHRAVARRAQVPASATSYYFTSIELVVVEALRRLGERWLTPGRTILTEVERTSLADRLVATVAGGGSRSDLVTFYERYVQAARTPAYARVVAEWTVELTALVAAALRAHGLDPAVARRVVAVIDGLLLAALAAGSPDPTAGLAMEVEAVLGTGRDDPRGPRS